MVLFTMLAGGNMMTDRISELEVQLAEKEQQLQQALDQLETLRNCEAENVEIIEDLIARMVHDINNMSTKIQSSSIRLSYAFNDLRQYLPTLLFDVPFEQQRAFFALVERASQRHQGAERLSSREERQFRRTLIQELEIHGVKDIDEVADTLVDMGVYEDIVPFLALLTCTHCEQVIQAAYSLASLQDIRQWSLQPAYHHIVQTTHILQHSIVALLANRQRKEVLSNSLDRALQVYRHLLERQKISVVKQYTESPCVNCYAGLELVWMNLIENAIEAIGSQGALSVSVSPQKEGVLVQLTDSGCGIPADVQEHIFERSFSTKNRSAVHGAGLYIVQKLIKKHHGTIKVESQSGNTTFRIWLPIGERIPMFKI